MYTYHNNIADKIDRKNEINNNNENNKITNIKFSPKTVA